MRFANRSLASITFIELAAIETIDPLTQHFWFISFCDSKLTVASIHIEGLKTYMESQKSNMAKSYYMTHHWLNSSTVDAMDELAHCAQQKRFNNAINEVKH